MIFTSKTGGGHISLAEALRDRLEADYAVDMLDPQPGVIHLHYRLVSRHALWLWSAEFRLSDGARRSRMAHLTFSALMARSVASALCRHQPDVVMTTYPFLTCEVTAAMRLLRRSVPFVMLFADPNGVHQSWLTERRASAVFAPTRETYQQALRAGFQPENLHLTGWPVRAQFYRDSLPGREAILARLGLDAGRFTVFLQGGGEGAAKFVRTVENILAVPNLQVILAAGTNRALVERFQGTPRLHAVPFTKEIAPYMAAADVVMGKAGPNMLFESVSLGRPFIATAFIPGQEEANLAFIRRHRLGWVALDARSQRELVAALSTGACDMAEALAGVDAYRAWNAAAGDSILPVVNRLIAAAPPSGPARPLRPSQPASSIP